LAIHAQLLLAFLFGLGWLFPALFGSILRQLFCYMSRLKLEISAIECFDNLESYLPQRCSPANRLQLPSSDIESTRRDVTLLSADLRNFSAYTESRPAEESAAVLHFFFQRATQIIEKCNGRIHEFNGDGLLAVWDGQGASLQNLLIARGSQMLEQLMASFWRNMFQKGLRRLRWCRYRAGPCFDRGYWSGSSKGSSPVGDTVTVALRVQEMTADLAQPILLGRGRSETAARYKFAISRKLSVSWIKKPSCPLRAPWSKCLAQLSYMGLLERFSLFM
jgi:class 3 adenylate cyclase